ncbi:hypothetical protein AVEN_85997-1 [Araneus ventricosus]|uniref:Uncharacterized protein n=1 Tax=Araneus ventricosus TaxID=182803 RepID=A0A4Y2SHT8_ARAVE|nr:hypothetical protein AVEN_85997-1 [Araneus ventricosus]
MHRFLESISPTINLLMSRMEGKHYMDTIPATSTKATPIWKCVVSTKFDDKQRVSLQNMHITACIMCSLIVLMNIKDTPFPRNYFINHKSSEVANGRQTLYGHNSRNIN